MNGSAVGIGGICIVYNCCHCRIFSQSRCCRRAKHRRIVVDIINRDSDCRCGRSLPYCIGRHDIQCIRGRSFIINRCSTRAGKCHDTIIVNRKVAIVVTRLNRELTYSVRICGFNLADNGISHHAFIKIKSLRGRHNRGGIINR